MVNPQRIWSSSQLPSLPSVAVRLLELTKDPETEIRQVVDAIKADPAISAKILKAANSSYFGLRSEVKSVDRAVPLLGTTVATSLALSFSLCDDAMNNGPMAEHYKQYWLQSVVQGATAELVASRKNPALAGEYFMCGLLLDLGRLAMLKTIAYDYKGVLEVAQTSQEPLTALETAKLEFDHVVITKKLMENWKLPEAMVSAAEFHHLSFEELQQHTETPGYPLLAAMNFSAAVGDYFCANAKGAALEHLRTLGREFLKLDEEQLQQFLQRVETRVTEAADLFNINLDDIADPGDLMTQANEQLVQLTMREHVDRTQAVMRQQTVEREKQDLEQRNRELQQQAIHDELTKIYNRKFFDETMAREVQRSIRSAAPIATIFIDIDHFKKINDTYGHQFGDIVLARVAELLKQTLRSSDVLARFGGEEFVILVSQPTDKGLERLAERLRERIEQEPFRFGDQPVQVTISLGASIAIPGRREQDIAKRLIAVSDECLYEAKRGGRNQLRMRSVVDEKDRQLLAAVTQQRFSRWLVTQQLVDIPTISKVLMECKPQQTKVGELGVGLGYLTQDHVSEILKQQELTGERFCTAAVRMKFLTQEQSIYLLTLQQEDPKAVSAAIIRQGIFPPEKALAALETYQKTRVPQPTAAALVSH